MDFMNLKDKNILITGLANKKSVAFFIAKNLSDLGARLFFSVQSEEHLSQAEKLFPLSTAFICNLEKEADILALSDKFTDITLDGLVHSVAFANYSRGFVPFHETSRDDFLQALNISCFSLTALCNALKNRFAQDASVITISISTTKMAAENYGYMAPIKAALDSSVCFLAKSFSSFSRVRFNAICAGLLKTSASAGIPGYIDSYLFAEKATLRKKNLETKEVADVAAFLLSPRSSGINAQRIVVDAGMEVNYFDREIIGKS